jgi:protein-S-isoprenylcysteine O-methyltransferase Ste14
MRRMRRVRNKMKVDALLEQVNQHDQVVHQIDAALAGHLATLHDAFFDLLAALITLLIFAVSLTHAVIRMMYAVVGIVLWTLALWMTLLQMLQKKVVARSHTSSFREVRHE